jgi:NTE family protein
MNTAQTEPGAKGPIALVLSGGGGRGAFECGAIERLTELAGPSSSKWPPDILVGTSIGATNAAVWAVGGTDRVHDMWTSIRPRDMHCLLCPRPWHSILDRAAWKKTLERYAPERDLAKVTKKLYIVATDTNTGRTIIFTNDPDLDDRSLLPQYKYLRYQKVDPIKHDHLLASSAIPYVYPKVELPVDVQVKVNGLYSIETQKHKFWDGAVTYNSPLEPAIVAGAKRIWAILLSPFHEEVTTPLPDPGRRLVAKISYVLDLGITATFENDLYQMLGRGRECAVIAPEKWLRLFDHVCYFRKRIEVLRTQGRTRAEEKWNKLPP